LGSKSPKGARMWVFMQTVDGVPLTNIWGETGIEKTQEKRKKGN